MMSISELLGIGTRENINGSMLVLQCVICLLLCLVPYMTAEQTGKKIYYVMTVACIPLYLLVLSVLGTAVCHNTKQSVFLMVCAIVVALEYGMIIFIRLKIKNAIKRKE